MTKHTLYSWKTNIIFLSESIIFSIFCFFLLRGSLYFFMPILSIIQSVVYFSYGKHVKDKRFIVVAFFTPLLIVCLIITYLDYIAKIF